MQSKERDHISVLDFGADPTGVADSTAAIQAAITYAASLNGGVINLPAGTFKISSTLTIGNSNIKLHGAGGTIVNDNGEMNAATTLNWVGGASTVVAIASPTGVSANKISGVEIHDLEIQGNGIATTGISITSANNGSLRRLMVSLCVTYSYLFTTYAAGAIGNNPSDTQGWIVDQCNYNNYSNSLAYSCIAFMLTSGSPGTAAANTSFNTFINCGGNNYSAPGFQLEDCDNNVFIKCSSYQVSSGTVGLLIAGGNTNTWLGPSFGGAGAIHCAGTASGYFANSSGNVFIAADESNNTQYPTLDAGCTVQWHGSHNGNVNLLSQGLVVANNYGGALSNLPNLSYHTALFSNVSEAGCVALTDTFNTVSLSFDASHNLRTVPTLSGLIFDLTQGNGMGFKATTGGFTDTVSFATGTATVAPIKFTAGVNLTTPEDGACEYDGTKYWKTVGTTRYRDQISNSTVLPSAITVGASPFVYQNTTNYDCSVLTSGGTVTLIEFSRDGATWYSTGSVTQGYDHLSPGDRLRITYTAAPVMTFIPR